jgi:hypothetical protein
MPTTRRRRVRGQRIISGFSDLTSGELGRWGWGGPLIASYDVSSWVEPPIVWTSWQAFFDLYERVREEYLAWGERHTNPGVTPVVERLREQWQAGVEEPFYEEPDPRVTLAAEGFFD